MLASMSNDPTRTACSATTPPRLMSAVSEVPPPTSMTMLASGSLIESPAPMAAAIGCSMSWASAAPARRAASVTARRSTSVMADGTQMTTRGPVEAADAGPLQQQADHALGDVEVGDGALAQRAHGDDVAGGAADHLPRLVAHGQHVAALLVERDHRRLVEDDALALGVDERVGRAEVDGEVAGHSTSPRCRDSAWTCRSSSGDSACISRLNASIPDSSDVGCRARNAMMAMPTRLTSTATPRKTSALIGPLPGRSRPGWAPHRPPSPRRRPRSLASRWARSPSRCR